MNEVKTLRNLKARPITTGDVKAAAVPVRSARNLRHSHLIKIARDITHITQIESDERVATQLRAGEQRRFNHNNSFYDALRQSQILLAEVHRREEALQTAKDELEANYEELQANTEELQATTEELESTSEELQRGNAYTRSLIEASMDPLLTISPEGKVTDVNRATESVTGYPREELIGSDFSSYFTEPAKAQAGYQEALQKGMVRDYALEIQHRDGRVTPVLYNASVYRDETGKVIGVFAAARDNTEAKRTQEALVRSNTELEQFAYSVSHDLRAPLRSIDGFSLALLQDYADRLDEPGKDYLQRVRSATQHMAELIDHLLSLSRIALSEMRQETVDLTALAQSIAVTLCQEEPERPVEFVIAPGLVVNGDRLLLRVLLENLLGNAWKFTGQQPQARIELGVSQEQGEPVYFVRDNGVGFDMTYVNKLFAPFQRLHAVSEFPGSGIGLATVQRIVHRHSGRVWAEGEVGKGAAFYFALSP